MIVEVRKAGVTLLRVDLATVIEMFASGRETFRPKCAQLARELENFWILRPFELVVMGGDRTSWFSVAPRLEETIEPEPDEDDLDDQADGSKN